MDHFETESANKIVNFQEDTKMTGTILENSSTKTLSILFVSLLFSFFIGYLIAPTPTSITSILGTICDDAPGSHNDTSIWLYSRGVGQCNQTIRKATEKYDSLSANRMVFVFQMPPPREEKTLHYSRWQQNLFGILYPDIAFPVNASFDAHALAHVTIDARLAYRNRGDPDNAWKFYASSLERRDLDCKTDKEVDPYFYQCSRILLFDLGSVHHDYYLLNIRLPVDSDMGMNLNIEHVQVQDMHLTTIYSTAIFNKVWFSLKTVFFPFIVAIMFWFWHRVHVLQRKPVLLETMLMYLGGTLTLLNLPIEYFTLAFDMPFMPLLNDLRQGVFYATLLSFWLVLAGEHMLMKDESTLKMYWRHLSAVIVGCISLFVFDVCESGVKLRRPFSTIWVSNFGSHFALTFIVLGGILAGIYFLFLCYMMWNAFCNINIKSFSLPTMSTVRLLHYEGIIYRFQFLMLATLLCAALTVFGFTMRQVSEEKWEWDDNVYVKFPSAFLTGVYGMWNIYIFSLMVLYAPSHKMWPADVTIIVGTIHFLCFNYLI